MNRYIVVLILSQRQSKVSEDRQNGDKERFLRAGCRTSNFMTYKKYRPSSVDIDKISSFPRLNMHGDR